MKINKYIKLIGMFTAVFCVFSSMSCAGKYIPYDAEVRNVGKKDIKNLKIYWGEHQLGVGGWLSPNQVKIHSRPDFPIPNEVSLSWERNGKQVFRSIKVDNDFKPISEDRVYNLIVSIDDNEHVSFDVVLCEVDRPCPE